MWYGSGSLKSTVLEECQNLGLLVSNISKTVQDKEIFDQAQFNQIDSYRNNYLSAQASGRVTVAGVRVPINNATASQVEKYVQYVQSRNPRTENPCCLEPRW